jgi:enamine deaminase RidA (YjgF/YER057c/UK114 family)
MTETTSGELRRIGVGERLSQGVIAGGMVYLAGQVAYAGSGDAYEQTKAVLAQIDVLLVEAGTDRTRLTQAIIWLQDMAGDFAEMNRAWVEWLDGAQPPARAAGEVKLADSKWRVEITAAAAL